MGIGLRKINMNLQLKSLIGLIALVTGVTIQPPTTVNATSLIKSSPSVSLQTKRTKLPNANQFADKNLTESAVSKKNSHLNCDEPITQLELNQCAAIESVQTEKKLQAIYHQLETQNSEDLEQLNLLKQNQSIWLKYRETSCQYASSQYEGGSIQPLIYSSCITGLTKERVENLESYLSP